MRCGLWDSIEASHQYVLQYPALSLMPNYDNHKEKELYGVVFECNHEIFAQ